MHPTSARMLAQATEADVRRSVERRRHAADIERTDEPRERRTTTAWTAILQLPRFGKAPGGA